jgi:hypothetical protein
MAKESKAYSAVKAVKMPIINSANLKTKPGTGETRVYIRNVPISDHPPVIADTELGVIVSANVWCPGTPLASSKNPDGVTEKLFLSDAKHQEQMEKTAQYYFDMAKAGTVAFALQELPLGLSYSDLNNKIQNLCDAHNNDSKNKANPITLEFKFLKGTKGTQSQTGLLVNTAVVDAEEVTTNPKGPMDGRYGCYKLTKKGSKKSCTLYNIHGDFNHQPVTKAFVEQQVAAGHMVCGDLNVETANKPRIGSKYAQIAGKCGETWDVICGYTPFDGVKNKPVVSSKVADVATFEKNVKAVMDYLETEDYEVVEKDKHNIEVSKNGEILFSMKPEGVCAEKEVNNDKAIDAMIEAAVRLLKSPLVLDGFLPTEEAKIKAHIAKMSPDIQARFSLDAPEKTKMPKDKKPSSTPRLGG